MSKDFRGASNISNIIWKYDQGDDVHAACSGLSDNELKFVNTVRECWTNSWDLAEEGLYVMCSIAYK